MYKTTQTFKKHIETHSSSCTSLKPQGVFCQLGITIVTGQLTTELPGKMEWLLLYKSHSLKVEFVKNSKVKAYKIITIRNFQTTHGSSEHKESLLKVPSAESCGRMVVGDTKEPQFIPTN